MSNNAYLCGGKPVFYRCDPLNEWNPDIEDIRAKVTDRTKAILVINPNNPTGAVYSREVLLEIAQVAREHTSCCSLTKSTIDLSWTACAMSASARWLRICPA